MTMVMSITSSFLVNTNSFSIIMMIVVIVIGTPVVIVICVIVVLYCSWSLVFGHWPLILVFVLLSFSIIVMLYLFCFGSFAVPLNGQSTLDDEG